MTFTATVSPSAATGTVQFQIDGTNFGGAVTVSGGKAVSGSTTSLTIGSHNITATYSGEAHMAAVQQVSCRKSFVKPFATGHQNRIPVKLAGTGYLPLHPALSR